MSHQKPLITKIS